MSDFCFSRPMLTRILAQAELMDRMMACLGVDPATAARADCGNAWYEARTRCIGCTSARQCRAWLSAAEMGAFPGPAEFCCNAAFLRDCCQRAPLPARAEHRRHVLADG